MKLPVLLATAVLASTVMVASSVHSQPPVYPYHDYYDHRDYDRYGRYGDRDRDGVEWGDRWRWRCQRDPDWCHRDCWTDYYGFLRCRHDDDDRYDWRQFWLYQRGYRDYYGRHP